MPMLHALLLMILVDVAFDLVVRIVLPQTLVLRHISVSLLVDVLK